MTTLDAELEESGRCLAAAIKHVAADQHGLFAREVCDAVSDFLLILRRRDPRADGGPQFTRDDGVVLLKAEQANTSLELTGYIWWISQDVQPLWASFFLDDQQQAVERYSIKCGLRNDPNLDEIVQAPGRRYLRRLLDEPGPAEVEKAWLSGRLAAKMDVWYFDFNSSAR